ncbi:uncharacterized protein F4812DRAFT_463553 [Daldinia caldariorum]|uniref:uncharacterized protein n=1 Tax=Daldinia caldariorum TaxID=326644 RepID=UPI0020078499|nr:uncharacterized protein F4812DRAFT_463553 [Daldinia caldariorum]KAI1463724.1 hypothetical protein F4812DRAFT_463553 [Daldinia caldariorum]
MADSTPPSVEQLGIRPHLYNLDDISMTRSLISRPPQNNLGVVSCTFQAFPLRHFGFQFRSLSDYGTIFHKSSRKLVIVINHRNPELLLPVLRHAWVNEYLELGARCIMRFGPLIRYQNVEVTFEREESETSHGTNPERQSQLQEEAQAQSTAFSNSINSSANPTPQRAGPLNPISEDQGSSSPNAHPMADFDYMSELKDQFARHKERFPEAYRIAARDYSGPRAYLISLPGGFTAYQSYPEEQNSRVPLPYHDSSKLDELL